MKRCRRSRGQSLVLGALLGVVVVVAILATVHVGVAVHRKEQAQDAADAAAYSLATLEARAFNFYSFANRTQASHYGSAMVLQSLLSFAYFAEAFLTDSYGVMRTLDACAGTPDGFWQVACPALRAVPGLGEALAFLDTVLGAFEGLVGLYQRTLQASGLDAQIGQDAIPTLRTMNSALALVSTAVMSATLIELREGIPAVLEANDPTARLLPEWSALSICMFDRAHVREANGSPLSPNLDPGRPILPRARAESDRRARAKRVMAQLANATRHGCDGDDPRCPAAFVTARTADALVLPQWLAPMRAMLGAVPKFGTTQLLTSGLDHGVDDGDGGNYLRETADTPGAGLSMLAQGDALGADDLYAIRLGPGRLGPFPNPFACSVDSPPEQCWGDPRLGRNPDRPQRFMLKTSIWALPDDEPGLEPGGIHWRVAFPDHPVGRGWAPPSAPSALALLGLNRFTKRVAGLPVSLFVANVRGIQDGNHRWAGLAPFMHFEPGQFAEACSSEVSRNGEARTDRATARLREFNQPSVWAVLASEQGGHTRVGPWTLNEDGTLRLFGGSLDLTSRGVVPPPAAAIARAQAYYHHPGAWAEPPNFFNPYWRPRLASVWQGRDAAPLVRELAAVLPEPLRSAPQRALTH